MAPDTSGPETARSRILTLVFTDLQDSTGLKSSRGDLLAGDVIARHRKHVARLAEECSGRIIDYAGDGCFLTFETSSAAVRFALRLQDVHHAEPDLPRVRVGVHMGEVTEAAGPLGAGGRPRVEGLAVDVAARIQGLARPGQVLLSGGVAGSAHQRLEPDAFAGPIQWRSYGAYELKGLDVPIEIAEVGLEGVAPFALPAAGEKGRPVRARAGARRAALAGGLALILVAALWAYFARGRSTPPPEAPIRSLAVLPFDNLMNDPAQDYFADGMTEALISELAKIGSLQVISRTSVLQYRDSKKTAPEIARELGVEGLIEGSVLRDGDQVRITAQLVHGPTDRHLWAESYTNTLTNVLRLHSDVALAIVAAVGATLTPEESQRVTGAGSVDPEAYEAFLLGMQLTDVATEDGLHTAIRHFERATQLDPDFAQAWVEISGAYNSLAAWQIEKPERAYPAARRAALRALELDPSLAWAPLAWVAHAYDWEWSEAQRLYRKAVALAPSDAEVRVWMAWILVQTGRYAEAVAEVEAALRLDPKSKVVRRVAASVLDYSGADPERAGRLLREVYAEDPTFSPVLDSLLWYHLGAGEHGAAIRTAEELVGASPREVWPRLCLARAHAKAGEREKAREILDATRRTFGVDRLPNAAFGFLLVDLAEMDEAFQAIERGFEEREWEITWLRVAPYLPENSASPEWEQLRRDPRYWDLVRRMNFPPFPPEHPGYADEQAQRAGLR